MRTTLTFEPAVERLVREAVYRSGKTFKQTVNDAIRAGLSTQTPTLPSAPFRFPIHTSGKIKVDVTKALALAAELEDATTLNKHTAMSSRAQ